VILFKGLLLKIKDDFTENFSGQQNPGKPDFIEMIKKSCH